MQELERARKTLEHCTDRLDNEIFPAMEEVDRMVEQYGFGSYMEMVTSMMTTSKTLVQACKSIKERSAIEEEIEEVDELLEAFEPLVNDMLPNIQNSLLDALPSEAFDDSDNDPAIHGLVKFITA